MPNDYLQIATEKFFFEEIKKGINHPNSYVNETLAFVKNWLNGTETFELTTSGSTGKPKPIKISRNQMISSAKLTSKALGLKANEKALVCVNTQFVAGKMMLVRALENEMTINVVEPVSNPLVAISDNDLPDFMAIVPLQLFEILNNEQTIEKLQKIRNVIVGGGAIAENQLLILKSLTNNVFHTYGMTETVSHIALKRLSAPSDDYFKVLDGVEIKMDGRDCLQIKAAVTNNEWITTNDIVKILPDNQINIKGRFDNVINTGGIKIQAEELEAKIEKIFAENAIQNAFYISSVPDQKLGNKVILVINDLKETSTIKNLLVKKLNKFEMPKDIISKKINFTSTGKIVKD
jgi:o-succinylbenzoate---CoA ligase